MPCPTREDRSSGEGAELSYRASIILAVVVRRLGAEHFRVAAPSLSGNPDQLMPRCTVVRRAHFNAAHRLHNPAKTDEWNAATFGLCNNPNYHGHNYELEVMVEGEVASDTGYVVDVAVLKEIIEREVTSLLDHKNLNLDVPWFATHLASAENIAVFIWQRLVNHIPRGRLARIRLWETPRNRVEYAGE